MERKGKSDGKLPIIMCLFTVEEILWMCTRDDVGRDGKRRYKVNFQFAVMAKTRRILIYVIVHTALYVKRLVFLLNSYRSRKGFFVQRCYDSLVNHGVTQAGMLDFIYDV